MLLVLFHVELPHKLGVGVGVVAFVFALFHQILQQAHLDLVCGGQNEGVCCGCARGMTREEEQEY